MEFISNSAVNHSARIVELINSSDEMHFAVAFIKQSGVNLISYALKSAVTRGAKINIVAGQYFSLTEPKALYSLHKILGKDSKLFLAHAKYRDKVFHPKLYLFRKGNKGTIICGSANLTKGGIEDNIECSIIVNCEVKDKTWTDAYSFILNLLKVENSEEASLLSIGKYEEFYESQRVAQKAIKAIPTRFKKQDNFNYNNLQIFFSKFKVKGGLEWLPAKEHEYKEAKKVLIEIADTRLSKATFAVLLDSLVGKAGEQGWWHSGSLFRNRRSVYKHYQAFQELVRYIRENKNKPAYEVFDTAMSMVRKIEGAGVNYVTEIMMTFNPKEFANLNNNPVKVLRTEGGVHMKATPSAYTGSEYERYCELVKEICSKLNLNNMLEADAFFNDIYWQIKEVEKSNN